MNRARDRRVNDPAYIEWQKEHQAELDAEKAAQAAAAANDPAAIYAATANAEAEQNRELVLNGVLSDAYLGQFGTIVRQPFKESQVEVAMDQFMTETTDYVRTRANAAVLVEFLYRNNLSPAVCGSYRIAHAILKLWVGYPDEVAPQPETRYNDSQVIDPVSLLTPSEAAIYRHQQYFEKIIGHDESGRGWTMQEIDALPSKEMLRLLRLFEQGHRGSNLLTVYREIQDIKQQQDAEKARIGAEEE